MSIRAAHIARIGIGLVAACGGGGSAPASPAAQASGAPASLDAPRATADDAIVATVDSHPVWASCVGDQLQRGAATREAALRDCVDVELLARVADRRGLATDRDVVVATRTALVSRLVETQFEDRVRTAADLPADLVDPAFAKNSWRMHRPEVRASGYYRVIVDKSAPAGGAIDVAAHALADKLADAAAHETGMFTVDLVALGDRITAGAGANPDQALKTEHADNDPLAPAQLVKSYADALYAIPAIGLTSPAVRTQWGWDVILWTDVLPPLETSRDDLLAHMFPDLRRAYFARWVNDIVRTRGTQIERLDANLPALDALDTAGVMP